MCCHSRLSTELQRGRRQSRNSHYRLRSTLNPDGLLISPPKKGGFGCLSECIDERERADPSERTVIVWRFELSQVKCNFQLDGEVRSGLEDQIYSSISRRSSAGDLWRK